VIVQGMLIENPSRSPSGQNPNLPLALARPVPPSADIVGERRALVKLAHVA
jgi:hypothetical protein